VHTLAPAAEYSPTPQAPVQAESESPAELPYRPAAHALHCDDKVKPEPVA
jgi:hypothetical protein